MIDTLVLGWDLKEGGLDLERSGGDNKHEELREEYLFSSS